MAIMLALAGIVNLGLKVHFAGNPGSAVEFNLLENIRDYVSLATYFGYERTYGLPSPEGTNIVTLAVLAVVSYAGWSCVSRRLRTHMLMALAINLPLFVLFGTPGELRNLSFLYVSFAALLGHILMQGSDGPQTLMATAPGERARRVV
jgi:hypothetical protein